MIKYFLFILFIFSFNNLSAMDKKPYHHIYKDGKLHAFRNLEGGPKSCLLYTSDAADDW